MSHPNRTPNPLYGSSSSGAPPPGQQPYSSHHQPPPHHSPPSDPHHRHQQPPPHHHHHQSRHPTSSSHPPPQRGHPSQHPQYQPKPQQPPTSHRSSQPQQQPPSSSSHHAKPKPQQQAPSSSDQQLQDQRKHIQHMSQEERLLKLWSNMRYTVASSFEKSHLSDTAAEQKNKKEFQAQFTELSKNILHFLTYRRDYHRLLSQIEAKLEGKAQERQALETYVRTAPRLGKRKRADTTDTAAIAEETPP